MYITLIATPCDLSEASFEDSFERVTKYSDYKKVGLYISPFLAREARKIELKFKDKVTIISVKPDWDQDMWMVCGQYSGIFSEGA